MQAYRRGWDAPLPRLPLCLPSQTTLPTAAAPQSFGPQQLAYLELPLLQPGGRPLHSGAYVALGCTGAALQYGPLATQLASRPGAAFDGRQRRVFVPLPGTDHTLYLGVIYTADSVKIRVYAVRPAAPYRVDLTLPMRDTTTVLRRSYPEGLLLTPALGKIMQPPAGPEDAPDAAAAVDSEGIELAEPLVAFEEVWMDDVALGELPHLQAREGRCMLIALVF